MDGLKDQGLTTSTGDQTPIFSPERAARQGDSDWWLIRQRALRGSAGWVDRRPRAVIMGFVLVSGPGNNRTPMITKE
jgi:hypothetical protein